VNFYKEIKIMTDNNKNIQQYLKEQLNTPKTQEVRYIETQDLYPDLGYEDIGSSRGYGPCYPTNYCTCRSAELRRQANELLQLAERRQREEIADFHLTVEVINSSGGD